MDFRITPLVHARLDLLCAAGPAISKRPPGTKIFLMQPAGYDFNLSRMMRDLKVS